MDRLLGQKEAEHDAEQNLVFGLHLPYYLPISVHLWLGDTAAHQMQSAFRENNQRIWHVEPGVVVMEAAATYAREAKPSITLRGVTVIRIADGLIDSSHVYYDLSPLMAD